MKKNTRLLLVLSVFIVGCADIKPFSLSDSQKIYEGVWHYFYEANNRNRFENKSMLLILNSDGTAIYKTCDMTVKHQSGSRSSSRTSMFLDQAFLTGLTSNELTLTQAAGFMNVDFDFAINKPPSEKNGVWTMSIDNVLLSKISDQDRAELIAWDCPESDDIQLAKQS